MRKSADVVVIGAGIIGLSVAYHILDRTKLRVIVIDRSSLPGAGATARATGGIRHQFATETNVRMTQISMKEYLVFEELFGVDLEFEPTGYLFVTGELEWLDVLRRGKELQIQLGVPTELLVTEDIHRRFSFVMSDDLIGGTFCGLDGTANPYAGVSGYLAGIRSKGGQLILAQEVVSLVVDDGHIRGVRTNKETIACAIVVNAAGAEADRIGTMAGIQIPVAPYRRQVSVVTGAVLEASRVPFLVDLDSGWYLHQQTDGSVLLGGTDRDTSPGIEEIVDQRIIESQIGVALRRVRGLQNARLIKTYVGIRALTSDDHAILGPVPECEGYYCACGLGGHGFMHAPAVGIILAQWILTGPPADFDASTVSIERFRIQRSNSESIVF